MAAFTGSESNKAESEAQCHLISIAPLGQCQGVNLVFYAGCLCWWPRPSGCVNLRDKGYRPSLMAPSKLRVRGQQGDPLVDFIG